MIITCLSSHSDTESNPSTNPNYSTQTLQQHGPNYYTFMRQYICVQESVSARESGATDNEFKVLQDQKTVTARVWRTVHRFPFESSQWENVAVQSVLWNLKSFDSSAYSFLWPLSHWVAPTCQKIGQKQRLKTSSVVWIHNALQRCRFSYRDGKKDKRRESDNDQRSTLKVKGVLEEPDGHCRQVISAIWRQNKAVPKPRPESL